VRSAVVVVQRDGTLPVKPGRGRIRLVIAASAAFVLAVVLVAALQIWRWVHPPAFSGQLPESAFDIQEQSLDSFPDWAYFVRASMPPAECTTLLNKVARDDRLSPHVAACSPGLPRIVPGVPGAAHPAWWQPPCDGTWFAGSVGDIDTFAGCSPQGAFFYATGSH
jgi:hypothetical protein